MLRDLYGVERCALSQVIPTHEEGQSVPNRWFLPQATNQHGVIAARLKGIGDLYDLNAWRVTQQPGCSLNAQLSVEFRVDRQRVPGVRGNPDAGAADRGAATRHDLAWTRSRNRSSRR